MSPDNREQIELAAELQMLLLNNWKELFDKGEMTAADRATLAKLLSGNGWDLSAHQLMPLAAKLEGYVNREEVLGDDLPDRAD